MNYIYKVVLLTGLIGLSPQVYALTPQALNAMRSFEKDLQSKFDAIDEINKQLGKSTSDKKDPIKSGKYELTIQSIEELTREINDLIKKISNYDKANGTVKQKESEKYLDTITSWYANGKVGTTMAFKFGSVQGIDQLQGPIDKLIDKIKTLFPGDIEYTSEVKMLSGAADGYLLGLEQYLKRINVKYPAKGFDTKDIFVGYTNGKNDFLELRDGSEQAINKLEKATDKDGKKIIENGSDIAKKMKEQIASIKKDGSNIIYKAAKTIAIDSIAGSFSFPRTPWKYIEDVIFDKFIGTAQNNADQNYDNSIAGSYLYMKEHQEYNQPIHEIATKAGNLLADTGEFFNTFLTDSKVASVIQDSKYADLKAAIVEFAKVYGRIALAAHTYIVKIKAADVLLTSSATAETKKFYNEHILTAAKPFTTGFKKFYNTTKVILELETKAPDAKKAFDDIEDMNLNNIA